MGYYIVITLISMFLSNSDSLTPIHIWVIEFFIFSIICVIAVAANEKDERDRHDKK